MSPQPFRPAQDSGWKPQDGDEGLDLSLRALTDSPHTLKAPRIGVSQCERYEERKSSPQ